MNLRHTTPPHYNVFTVKYMLQRTRSFRIDFLYNPYVPMCELSSVILNYYYFPLYTSCLVLVLNGITNYYTWFICIIFEWIKRQQNVMYIMYVCVHMQHTFLFEKFVLYNWKVIHFRNLFHTKYSRYKVYTVLYIFVRTKYKFIFIVLCVSLVYISHEHNDCNTQKLEQIIRIYGTQNGNLWKCGKIITINRFLIIKTECTFLVHTGYRHCRRSEVIGMYRSFQQYRIPMYRLEWVLGINKVIAFFLQIAGYISQ